MISHTLRLKREYQSQLNEICRASQTYRSILAEGKYPDAMCVSVLEYRDRLYIVGIPDADVGVFTHLASSYQRLLWMKCKAITQKNKTMLEAQNIHWKLVHVCHLTSEMLSNILPMLKYAKHKLKASMSFYQSNNII